MHGIMLIPGNVCWCRNWITLYRKLGADSEAGRKLGEATQRISSHFATESQIDAVGCCLIFEPAHCCVSWSWNKCCCKYLLCPCLELSRAQPCGCVRSALETISSEPFCICDPVLYWAWALALLWYIRASTVCQLGCMNMACIWCWKHKALQDFQQLIQWLHKIKQPVSLFSTNLPIRHRHAVKVDLQ